MSFWDSASAGSVEEGLVGGDESWPHLHWEDDGGGEPWGSSDGGPSFEVDHGHDLSGDWDPSVEWGNVSMAVIDKEADDANDPGVDQVSNEVGILSLFDEHLSFNYYEINKL